MDPVVHFEMPAEDRKRMAEFYKKTFGWEIQMFGPEMGNYVMAMTAKSDKKGPIEPGSINGGFFEKTPDSPMKHPSVVVQVTDIQASMQKVKDGGGTVLGEPMKIPGVGLYVVFVDTEGNKASMMQPE